MSLPCGEHISTQEPFLWRADPPVVQISRALREHANEKLVDLDLGYNEIKDDGACALAQV